MSPYFIPALVFFGFRLYAQELARLGCVNKKDDGTTIQTTKVLATHPRGMFVTRANFYSLIDVLLVHGINPELKDGKLAAHGDTVGHVVTAMTTPWNQLNEDQQNRAGACFKALSTGVDRGIAKMLPVSLSGDTWSKFQRFPSLAHVILGLTMAMKKKYKTSKALTNHLFCGGCMVAPEREEKNSLNNIWVTKSVRAKKESPMIRHRIPNWHALRAVSPADVSAGGQSVFVSLPHAAALFCHPTRADIDHKPYNATKMELSEWEPDETLDDKVIDYYPKKVIDENDDDDDKDDVKTKKSPSFSINPEEAFRELQRIAEIAMEMQAEPGPSNLVSALEHSILELGNKLGLNRFENLTQLKAALSKQNGLGVNFTHEDIVSLAEHLNEISEMNFQHIQAQAEEMTKCLAHAGDPRVHIDSEWEDNGREVAVFRVNPKFFGVIHDAVLHGHKAKKKQADWITKAISMIESVEGSESWICTIRNLRHTVHYEFTEEQIFAIISRAELERMGVNDYKLYRKDEDSEEDSDGYGQEI